MGRSIYRYRLCNYCVKDPNLIRFINQKGTLGECCLCGEARKHTIEPEAAADLFKALIRYHYSEWDYNPHVGGNSFYELLSVVNPIIDISNITRAEAADEGFSFDELLMQLYEPAMPGYRDGENDGVWLFAGSGSIYYESLGEQRSRLLQELAEMLMSHNYYALEAQWKNILNDSIHHIATELPSGARYFRARPGVFQDLDKWHADVFELRPSHVVIPFTGTEIGSPPQFKATPGRLNRSNIAFLYLATDATTAVAEVRPYPGHTVSIGQFELKRPIRVANLADVALIDFAKNEKWLNKFLLLKNIERAFATPVLPSEITGYLPTQFLADIIRQLGYDGVTYRSSIAGGTNLTVFDPGLCAYVEGSADARRILSVDYIYETPKVELERETDRTGDIKYSERPKRV